MKYAIIFSINNVHRTVEKWKTHKTTNPLKNTTNICIEIRHYESRCDELTFTGINTRVRMLNIYIRKLHTVNNDYVYYFYFLSFLSWYTCVNWTQWSHGTRTNWIIRALIYTCSIISISIIPFTTRNAKCSFFSSIPNMYF